MSDVAAPPRPSLALADALHHGGERRHYAGARTKAAADWLHLLECDHGAATREGAEILLTAIDTRRFMPTVTPGGIAIRVAFHVAGRAVVAARLRRDNGLVELALPDLAAALHGQRPAAGVAGRLAALSPASFRWTEADGCLPGLQLAACADEETAIAVASLLDTVLVTAVRLAVPRRFGDHVAADRRLRIATEPATRS